MIEDQARFYSRITRISPIARRPWRSSTLPLSTTHSGRTDGAADSRPLGQRGRYVRHAREWRRLSPMADDKGAEQKRTGITAHEIRGEEERRRACSSCAREPATKKRTYITKPSTVVSKSSAFVKLFISLSQDSNTYFVISGISSKAGMICSPRTQRRHHQHLRIK